ncbi:MAG: stalk domain-containing protein [Defluviitaleaceae bacterium]|nr:stalk domain-containing protein [Defluviitaleaceae bacterium]
MKAKRFLALISAILLTVAIFPPVALASDDIDESNRGLGFARMFSASPDNANWDSGFNHIYGPFVEFDVTREGLHTLELPPWPRDDIFWVGGNTCVFFLSPLSPTETALPVSLESIEINGVTKIGARQFVSGGSFWNETPGTYFGNITFGPSQMINSVPGYDIRLFSVPDIIGEVPVDQWSSAGPSALLGEINEGDIVRVTFRVGIDADAPPPEPVELPERPNERLDFPAGTRFIALTFDDGPNTNYTVQILDELARLGATASFYVNPVKFNESTLPIVRRMISEGHDVENHSWNHSSFGQDMGTGTITTAEAAFDDLTRTSQAIFDATGYWPFSFRAPFFQWGGENDILLGLDRELNLAFVDSGMDTNDWQDARSPQDIADFILDTTSPEGGIILLHDCGGSRQRTVDSLELFIPEMQERGYEFVSVRQLMMLTQTMPQMLTGANMWPRANQWAPARGGTVVPLWPDYPNWWEQDWWTDATPPWERGETAQPQETQEPPTLPPIDIDTDARVLVVQMESYDIVDMADNSVIETMDVRPANIDGRTMLPVRFLAYALGAEVDWLAETETVVLTLGEQTLSFGLGETVEGMDVPAQSIGGRTMVPLRFIGEFFGTEIEWDNDTRSVLIIV